MAQVALQRGNKSRAGAIQAYTERHQYVSSAWNEMSGLNRRVGAPRRGARSICTMMYESAINTTEYCCIHVLLCVECATAAQITRVACINAGCVSKARGCGTRAMLAFATAFFFSALTIASASEMSLMAVNVSNIDTACTCVDERQQQYCWTERVITPNQVRAVVAAEI